MDSQSSGLLGEVSSVPGGEGEGGQEGGQGEGVLEGGPSAGARWREPGEERLSVFSIISFLSMEY